jgi:hypothetical protein
VRYEVFKPARVGMVAWVEESLFSSFNAKVVRTANPKWLKAAWLLSTFHSSRIPGGCADN